ncbi:hypothetical protein [Terriglobus sp.]|uniref:hypothetical protein n=1 Tax=Terriglobus sp. TaxID=1889013 RepID=UPI003B00F4CB
MVALSAAAVCATLSGQAAPTATAPAPYSQFALPGVGGELRYALTASESLVSGYNGNSGSGVNAYTNVSGDLAYLSRNPLHQFSAVYAGGYLFGNSTFPSNFYQSLTLSQNFRTRSWNFLVGDSVSYLPQTPVGSLSGIPGAGDQGLAPVVINSTPTLGILTTYATRIGNVVSGTVSRDLTASTSFSLSGADSIQRYTGSSTGFQGIDNDQQSASASLQHRINERTSAGGSYSFTNSTFQSSVLLGPGSYGYQTHSAQVSFTREITPQLNVVASVGPQWTVSGSNAGLTRGSAVNVAATAALSYQARRYNAGLNYSRGVNNGNGVVIGSRLDSVVGNISRPFARIYNVGALVGWNHSAQLGNSTLPNFDNQGVVGGGQLSVQVSRSISAFASYTLQRQSFSGYAPAGIAFNGLTQYGTLGVTYSPKPIFSRK